MTTSELTAAMRRLRLRKKISLRRAAAEIGISPTYLSQLERGMSPARKPKVLVDIAKFLGLKDVTITCGWCGQPVLTCATQPKETAT